MQYLNKAKSFFFEGANKTAKQICAVAFIILAALWALSISTTTDAHEPPTADNIAELEQQHNADQSPAPVEDAKPMKPKTSTDKASPSGDSSNGGEELEEISDEEKGWFYAKIDEAKEMFADVVDKYNKYIHDAEVTSEPANGPPSEAPSAEGPPPAGKQATTTLDEE